MLNKIVQYADMVSLMRMKRSAKSIQTKLETLRNLTWWWIDAQDWYACETINIQLEIVELCKSFTELEDDVLYNTCQKALLETTQGSQCFALYNLYCRCRKTANFGIDESHSKYWHDNLSQANSFLFAMYPVEEVGSYENYKNKKMKKIINNICTAKVEYLQTLFVIVLQLL